MDAGGEGELRAARDLKDKDAGNVISIRKLFNSRPDYLNKTAEISVNLAKLLRGLKPTAAEPRMAPFESYVLHTLNGSLVCVGQFDGPDDPKLLEVQGQLGMISFDVGDPKKPAHDDRKQVRLFDRLYAMKVR